MIFFATYIIFIYKLKKTTKGKIPFNNNKFKILIKMNNTLKAILKINQKVNNISLSVLLTYIINTRDKSEDPAYLIEDNIANEFGMDIKIIHDLLTNAQKNGYIEFDSVEGPTHTFYTDDDLIEKFGTKVDNVRNQVCKGTKVIITTKLSSLLK